MKKFRWAFIINPIAGNGKARRFKEIISKIAQTKHISAEIVFTEKKEHAIELAKQFANASFSPIVAVGGDGTINECVNGIMRISKKKQIIFGAIPAGTGNDFISVLGFPESFTETHWDIFFQCNTAKMDVGYCNERCFVNGMGVGFDAQVAWENYNSRLHERVKGGEKTKYLWHIIKNLITYREKTMRLTIGNDSCEVKSLLNTIANGRRLAGGFYITPEAFADDGLLDVCMIHELSFLGRIREFAHVIRKTHLRDSQVQFFRTRKLTIEFPEETIAHLDGELYRNKKFEIGIVRHALRIIFNPYGNHFFANQ
ncbi:MAG: diacylglycerol kinase family lipid kinase [Spirochaetes bacterium]|nr:diacylglycerol kinase family lipid kinase [Spirochaetota bacterium]